MPAYDMPASYCIISSTLFSRECEENHCAPMVKQGDFTSHFTHHFRSYNIFKSQRNVIATVVMPRMGVNRVDFYICVELTFGA